MSDLLQVTTEQTNAQIAVHASGEIDVSSSDGLQAAIDKAVEAGPSELLLDLQGVEFIDSTGIRCLLHTAELCEGRSIVLRVRPSNAVQRLAELTGITDRLVFD